MSGRTSCDVCQRTIANSRDMLECCQCPQKFHIRCVATSPEEFTAQGWSCPACRRAPAAARVGGDAVSVAGAAHVPMRVILRVHGQKSNAIKATGPSVSALREKWGAATAARAVARRPSGAPAYGGREPSGRRLPSQHARRSSVLFEVGAPVEGCFEGGEEWYPGVIALAHSDGTFDVDYNDGDQEEYVSAALIRPLPQPPLAQPKTPRAPKDPAATASSSSSGRRSRRPGWHAEFTNQDPLLEQKGAAVPKAASASGAVPKTGSKQNPAHAAGASAAGSAPLLSGGGSTATGTVGNGSGGTAPSAGAAVAAAYPADGGGCEVCRGAHALDQILLCDGCNAEYHMFCLDPPLLAVPETDWFCPKCTAKPSRDMHVERMPDRLAGSGARASAPARASELSTAHGSNDPAAKGSAAAKRFDGDVARSVAASGEIVGHGSVDPHANRASASNEIITKSASQNHPASSSSDWLMTLLLSESEFTVGDSHGLREGLRVKCRQKAGRVSRGAIQCDCCSHVFSISGFERHADCESRSPYDSVMVPMRSGSEPLSTMAWPIVLREAANRDCKRVEHSVTAAQLVAIPARSSSDEAPALDAETTCLGCVNGWNHLCRSLVLAPPVRSSAAAASEPPPDSSAELAPCALVSPVCAQAARNAAEPEVVILLDAMIDALANHQSSSAPSAPEVRSSGRKRKVSTRFDGFNTQTIDDDYEEVPVQRTNAVVAKVRGGAMLRRNSMYPPA